MIMRAIWTRLAPGIATLALALASGAANADCDFLTGGGFIIVNNGRHANFGVAGGCSKDGTPTWGHLEYMDRSEEHTSELQSPCNLVCRLLLEKKKKKLTNSLQKLRCGIDRRKCPFSHGNTT